MDASFQRLLLIFALAICAVFALRYAPILMHGNAHFAEDFAVYWKALAALADWPPVSPYHAAADSHYFEGLIVNYHPYLNPPFFLLLLWPLKSLPYSAAIAVWYAAQLALWLWVMNRKDVRALWPHWSAQKYYLAKSFVFALPFILNTVLSGQIGLLLAALFILGLGLLKEKPFAAGLVFSLLAVKPQLLPAVGILLLFGRHGSALFSYLAGVAALVILSTAIWGMGVWQDYNAALALHTQMMSLPQIPAAFQMQLISVYGGLKLLGVETAAAFLAQAAVAVAALAALAWRAYKAPLAASTLALMLVSVYLTSFYVLAYDALALAAALLLLSEKPLNLLGRLVVILALAAGILAAPLQLSGLPVGMLTVLFLWGLCLHQAQKGV